MDDIYCYKGTNVLRNLQDIHDKDILDELERESTNTKIVSLELRSEQIVNDISIEHLNELHRFLFGNLYEWEIGRASCRERVSCGSCGCGWGGGD